MDRHSLLSRALALFLSLSVAVAIDLDITSQDSIKDAAKTIAGDLMASYKSSLNNPGLFGSPYYWWESGAVWGGMIDYWFLTGDGQYNDIVRDALLAQVGQGNDYMPANQSKVESNDDQAVWGLSALSAAERSFPTPPSSSPSYLSLAETVFNEQARRWDNATGGGLHWLIFVFENGYQLKPSAANGAFFQLAARLAQFTGNQTYANWAETAYSWSETTGIVKNGSVCSLTVIGPEGESETGCVGDNLVQNTLTTGLYLYGSAVMWNLTKTPTWQTRTTSLLNSTAAFFPTDDIMTEIICEPRGICDTSQLAYKGLLSRWLARTAMSAPFLAPRITPWLRASAQAAAKHCAGGPKSTACGTSWVSGNSTTTGLGQELSALEVVQANLVPEAEGLAINGHSTTAGNGSAGSSASGTASGSVTASPTPNGGSVVVSVSLTAILVALVGATIGVF